MTRQQNKHQQLKDSPEQEEWSFLWIVMILIVTLTGIWFMWQNQAAGLLR